MNIRHILKNMSIRKKLTFGILLVIILIVLSISITSVFITESIVKDITERELNGTISAVYSNINNSLIGVLVKKIKKPMTHLAPLDNLTA